MWVRGLKRPPYSFKRLKSNVAPHVGAWIETLSPLWSSIAESVAPHVGAWIETVVVFPLGEYLYVAPHVGAWIET